MERLSTWPSGTIDDRLLLRMQQDNLVRFLGRWGVWLILNNKKLPDHPRVTHFRNIYKIFMQDPENYQAQLLVTDVIGNLIVELNLPRVADTFSEAEAQLEAYRSK